MPARDVQPRRRSPSSCAPPRDTSPRPANLCLGALVEAVRDHSRSVDLKQVNRVLLQPPLARARGAMNRRPRPDPLPPLRRRLRAHPGHIFEPGHRSHLARPRRSHGRPVQPCAPPSRRRQFRAVDDNTPGRARRRRRFPDNVSVSPASVDDATYRLPHSHAGQNRRTTPGPPARRRALYDVSPADAQAIAASLPSGTGLTARAAQFAVASYDVAEPNFRTSARPQPRFLRPQFGQTYRPQLAVGSK